MNPLHNSILASLPANDFAELEPHLRLVSLVHGQVLFEMGEIPVSVHFPVGAIVSMINDLPSGETIELHMLGRTCMVGVAAIDTPSFYRASVRVTGLAYRVPLEVLKALRLRSPDYFVQAQMRIALLMSHIAQRTTCVNYHPAEQQVIRWMLLMLDRQFDPVIQVTHSELAKLIGVRREAITIALGDLGKMGLVSLLRGSIQVIDRPALELLSCDCYWNALGNPPPRQPVKASPWCS